MGTLSEAESKRLLAQLGIAVTREVVVPTAVDAARAADDLGFPVVLKLTGDALAHKSERGLVKLGLTDGASVERAGQALLEAARPEDGEVALLVAEFVSPDRELLLGYLVDRHFGPMVAFGVGGVLTEALGGVVFAPAPLSSTDAELLVDRMPHAALLGPLRGKPAVDRTDLVKALAGLGSLADLRPDILSVDVNPAMVRDGAIVAVDALVELDEARS